MGIEQTFARFGGSGPAGSFGARQDDSYRDRGFSISSNIWAQGGGAPTAPSGQSQSPQPLTWTNTGNSGPSSSGTPGDKLTDIVTPDTPNSATVLGLHDYLLNAAGSDARFNATEGAAALFISKSEMERIIEFMGGEDATSVHVADMMEKLEPFAGNQSPPRVSNAAIDNWIMEMKGGRNNFFSWAGEDGQLNRSQFWNLVQSLMNGYDGEHANALNDIDGVNQARSNQLFGTISGADNKIDPNEFGAEIAELDDDGKFNWEAAQNKVAELVLQLGEASGQGTSSGQGGNPYTITLPGGGPGNWTPDGHP
jgi:hypothetical protein